MIIYIYIYICMYVYILQLCKYIYNYIYRHTYIHIIMGVSDEMEVSPQVAILIGIGFKVHSTYGV